MPPGPEASPPPWEFNAPMAATAERPCPHCGLPVVVGKKFCRHCGKPQPPVEEPQVPPTLAPLSVPVTPPSPQEPLPTPPPSVASATPSTVICKVCGLALADTAHFCGHCGANVVAFRAPATPVPEERKCPSCMGKIAPSARFCAFCGQMVG